MFWSLGKTWECCQIRWSILYNLIHNFFHFSCFSVLDEATSQIGTNMERRLYEMCKAKNITLISVGHRESLLQYHQLQLQLHGDGSWSLSNIESTWCSIVNGLHAFFTSVYVTCIGNQSKYAIVIKESEGLYSQIDVHCKS